MRSETQITLSWPLNIYQIIEFVKKADSFSSSIQVCKGSITLNGKALLGILSFFNMLKKGESFRIITEGEDSKLALQRLKSLLLERQLMQQVSSACAENYRTEGVNGFGTSDTY